LDGTDEIRGTWERILGAALRLFAGKGFEATGIREIASDAGVTTATLYHHAATKEDLLLTLMRRGMERLLEATGEMTPQLRKPEQKLVALVRLHVVVHGVHQLSAIVNDTELRALSEEHRASIVGKRDEYEAYWRVALADGISRGVFSVEDPKMAAFALLQMCTGVAHWYSPDGELPIGRIGIRFADMALALAGAKRDGKQLRVTDLKLPGFVENYLAEASEDRGLGR
jgi:AcrR family transcriptional regulator